MAKQYLRKACGEKMIKKLVLLSSVFMCFFGAYSYAEDESVVNEKTLSNSKYGELVLRNVEGHSYIDSDRRGNIFIGVDPVIDIIWKSSKDELKANLFVISTERSSPTCPIGYVIMDLSGDVPIFSAPLVSCAKDEQVKISLTHKGELQIVSVGESELESNTWIYKNGILLEK